MNLVERQIRTFLRKHRISSSVQGYETFVQRAEVAFAVGGRL